MAMDIEKTTHYRPEVEASDGGSARLTIFDGSAAPYQVDLRAFGKSVVTFGRGADNDIVLKSALASRRHGQIRFTPTGCIVDDLGSTNGVMVNGVYVNGAMLRDNDTIRIDNTVETTNAGVLMVFSGNADSEKWRTKTIAGRQEITVGRDGGCDIVLKHVGVSALHARIVAQNGAYYLIDNNSTNGMWVNGRRADKRTLLHEKDVITITNSRLIYSEGRITYCTFNRGIRVDANHIVKAVDHGKKIICNDVSLHIEPCELVAIIGGSGAGKSTIMNCISGYSTPTSGEVRVNGMDLYENFESMKNIIGYVPQQDIVFENLTVYDMLKYTADLRLPKDTSAKERQEIILKVIETVELTARKDTLIRKLSGGQKKRASIAVELISDPNLFFLDEPASGLDPGTERNLMRTLKGMAAKGKTVIFVTHSTLNLHLCDKIVFMGAGGRLCFVGNYQEALAFFGVDDLVDVYNMITDNAEYWQQQYAARVGQKAPNTRRSMSGMKKSAGHGPVHQMLVLFRRHMHILFNDRVRLLLILLQAPLLAFLISFVADDTQFEQYEMTKSLLFALSCSAFWVGILNSIQEICKERVILKREYMTGLRIGSYIVSKLCVMALVCMVQAVLLVVVFAIAIGCPDEGVLFPPLFELFLVTFWTALAASAMGLFVSALFKNADRAMTIAPILLMPQLLFSGQIFKLEDASEVISWLATCRFSMEGYGTTADLNHLPNQLQVQNLPIEREMEDFFEYTGGHFLFAVMMLVVFVVVFSFLAALVLRNVKKER
ncbi:MAG: FHA domain-containing protein [Clostridia bacterium]|nr:FHA domain-containing protein [Clostridia bacterium]